MRSLAVAALAAASLTFAGAAQAHEVLHEVQRGNAVAVRVYESDGEAVAGAEYEVYSPADPRVPTQKGRTDRAGWLAFVPDVAGDWRVKVVDDTGHGLDLRVPAAPAAAAGGGGAPSAAAFALRPVVGAAAIVAVFGALFLLQRRRSRAR